MEKTMLFVVLALLTLGLGVSCDDDSGNNSTACSVGETRNGTTVCGVNGEGVYVQSCVEGQWQDTTSCTGTDECSEDATQVGETPCNETGFFIQGCTDGAWVDTTACTENGCTPDATQVGTTVCGLNGEGFFMQLCNASGTWDDTTACTGTDLCVNGTEQDGTTVCNDTGVVIQECTEGQWVDTGNCTVGGCVHDATQVGTTACGLNDEGFYVQLCNASGVWEDTTQCTGTDICVNGTHQDGTTVCNDTGVLIQDCVSGQWVDSSNCTVGGCVEDATQVGTTACGLNDEGFYVQLCNASGTWDDTTACTGTDICVNGTVGSVMCGDGNGVISQICTSGAWVDDGGCVCSGGYYWDGATCAEAVTIVWCDIVFPHDYEGTVGVAEEIYAQVYGEQGGVQVTASGTELATMDAQLCYDDAGTEVCQDAAYNALCASCGNNDEYFYPLTFSSAGTYDYYYRFSGDMGATWTTCSTTYTATVSGSGLPDHLVINEVDYEQAGIDASEFIEIFNPTGADVDLTNVAVVLINGSNGTEYARYNLADAGATLGAGEYLVIGQTAVVSALPGTVLFIEYTAQTIQNGAPDGIALIDTATNTLIDAFSYEGAVDNALPTGFTAPVSLVEGTFANLNDTGDGSYGRLPNGTDTDDMSSDWSLSTIPTPGLANVP